VPQPHAARTTIVQLLVAALLTGTGTHASAQPASPAPIDATALVRRAVQHRLDAAAHHHPLQYVIRRVDERRDSTKAIIETADGDVARLIAIDGKPLTAEVNQAELARLDTLAQHPELEERRRRNEARDNARIMHLLSLLPDAFLYTSAGTSACGTSQCYRLSFIPNPHWTSPDIEANIFHGIAGELWIDKSEEQLVRLDGHFIADVDFGFGFIGRLNKGGTVLLQQSDVGNNDWELTGLTIHVAGKAFLFKSFTYQVDEQGSHYFAVAPGLHYRDAINILKKLDLSSTAP
jgi:hypothetical protein